MEATLAARPMVLMADFGAVDISARMGDGMMPLMPDFHVFECHLRKMVINTGLI